MRKLRPGRIKKYTQLIGEQGQPTPKSKVQGLHTAFQLDEISSNSVDLTDEEYWEVKGLLGSHIGGSINQTGQLKFKMLRNKEPFITYWFFFSFIFISWR